jgi:glycerol kinase
MPSALILAIDQGTTNTKALLVNMSGAPVFVASAPVGLIHSELGHVEQDPDQIWQSVLRVIGESALYTSQSGNSIAAVALSNQRETAVAWDKATGTPVGNAISWQCPRSAEICRRMAPHAALIRAKTGLPLATLTSAGKWAWLIENDSSVRTLSRAKTLRFGTVDSWVVHRLTGGSVHATDFSNASRTGLLNLESLTWDTDLLDLFGLPLHAMPTLRSSSGSFGACSNVPGFDGVPILAVIGDSHAAMFGHGHYTPGTVKATYGTGSSLMALTPHLPADTLALARTIAWSISGQTQFALEGNIAMTGSAVQWVGEFLGLSNPSREAADLAATVVDADGVCFVPAMVGLGAPYWDASARGTITGLGRSHTSAHLARAAIEAIAYQVTDVFYAMEQAGNTRCAALHADGGAARNHQLMQFQADILGRPLLRSGTAELSAFGASLLAGLALGWWNSLAEIADLPRTVDHFAPAMVDDDRKRRYASWKRAVARALLNPEAAV